LTSPNNDSNEKVIELLKRNPNVIHLVKSISAWELEAEIEYENIEKIYDYINCLKNELSDIIRKIELVSINNEIKLDFFPENLI
jgi:PIN domain nuclease of toxin-antitoxin system